MREAFIDGERLVFACKSARIGIFGTANQIANRLTVRGYGFLAKDYAGADREQVFDDSVTTSAAFEVKHFGRTGVVAKSSSRDKVIDYKEIAR